MRCKARKRNVVSLIGYKERDILPKRNAAGRNFFMCHRPIERRTPIIANTNPSTQYRIVTLALGQPKASK